MNQTEVARGLRRARRLRWIGVVAMLVSVVLFEILAGDSAGTTTGRASFYGGLLLGAGLSAYASTRQVALRREQRRLDREEYRRLVSGQRSN